MTTILAQTSSSFVIVNVIDLKIFNEMTNKMANALLRQILQFSVLLNQRMHWTEINLITLNIYTTWLRKN